MGHPMYYEVKIANQTDGDGVEKNTKIKIEILEGRVVLLFLLINHLL